MTEQQHQRPNRDVRPGPDAQQRPDRDVRPGPDAQQRPYRDVGTGPDADENDLLAGLVIEVCRERGLTLAAAESLTGGLVCAALTSVPGASLVVRGAVVAYATDRKAALLAVPATLLAERGAVDADVARAMADGVRQVMSADVGLATTGVAGPDPQDGHRVGTVFVAVSAPGIDEVVRLQLDGTRAAIRAATVRAVLTQCLDALGGSA